MAVVTKRMASHKICLITNTFKNHEYEACWLAFTFIIRHGMDSLFFR